MSHKAYVAIGTNLGDRLGNYRKALAKIDELTDTRVTRRSSLYESEPHGNARNWFLNGVVEISTEIDSRQLLKDLLRIETELGRKREKSKKKSVSRVIDLDIVLFDNETIDSRNLKIPHPQMPNRRFVLLPLSELVPAAVHPILGVSISALLATTEDTGKVLLFKEPT